MSWAIPRIWEGGECWIIGGGPSIPHEFGVPEDVISTVQRGEAPLDVYSPYLSRIHDKHVIAVNAAFMLGDWVDFVFFGDGGFYFANKSALLKFPKPKIACNGTSKDRKYERTVKKLHRDNTHPNGITKRHGALSWNHNSGACAINLAYHFGVKKIYLLGFDMDVDTEKNQHFHRHYLQPGITRDAKKLPFHRHIKSFPMIARDAKRYGLEIINVSQTSKITEFKKMTIEEALK